MVKFLRKNGLSVTFFLLFAITIAGQTYFGFHEYNDERVENKQPAIEFPQYFSSGHFLESTFENWESEFLQMALFVWLTIFLCQKGSSESKKFDGTDEVDREPSAKTKDAPWPVKKGGFLLLLYKNSLTISLMTLFLLSFVLHFYGSFKSANEELQWKELPAETVTQYLADSKLWFESFQNWQSEFLSVFAIIVLSIYLRQKGSPQSKPVDAPNEETGE